MSDIAILVPMLKRGDRARRFMEGLTEWSAESHRVVFLVSPHDEDTRRACLGSGGDVITVPFELAPGDYARKINHGVWITTEPWVLQCAVDVLFHKGWDTELMRVAAGHGSVIGTNDLGNPLTKAGRHATHSLIRRTYIEEHGTIDEPGKALHEGYYHCWVDNELVETAVSRRVWVSARRSHVEHLHYIWHKGADDDTYRRGMSHYRQDNELFRRRRPLWRSRPVR